MTTKRLKEIQKLVEGKQDLALPLGEALDLLKKCPKVKFDESVEVSVKVGVDQKKADQQVRGTVSLPHGTGKNVRVLVFAKGEKIKEALEAGAIEAGEESLVEKVKGGFIDFDVVIATPEMMREVGKLGKVLGPKGLMPAPKAGTVTNEVGKTVKELKTGKVEFKVDKNNLINNLVGKLSFSKEALIENIRTFMEALQKARPASAKGIFLQTLYVSSTMGPGLKVDLQSCLTL